MPKIDGDVILKAGLDTLDITSKIKSLEKTITRGLKNVIRIGFGVRSVFALIRKMRSALIEGFGNLAKVYEPFNTAVSNIMTALESLKNSFASAFAPLIEVVSPILTAFINKIVDAVNAIGMFIAALTGKDFVKASVQQTDYAASLDKSASSANKATKATKAQNEAAKKLQRTLAKFDDVNILKEDDDKSNGSTPSSGGGGGASGVSFEPVSIDSAITGFAEKLKEAWEKADFTEIGRIVGEKLKHALDNIPWPKIKETLNRIAKSIATFLNGFLETPGLFDSVGKTIAEAINTTVESAGTFIEEFHWNSLGTAVRTTIVSALENINWDSVNKTLSGFATGLATFLNNLFKPDTFKAIGNTVAELLNAAFSALNDFGTTFDFKMFGISLAMGVNAFLRKFDPVRFTNGVRTLVEGLRDTIVNWLKFTNWTKLGTELRDVIKNLPWKTLLLGFGAVFWNAINAVIGFFKGLFDTENIESPFTTALNSVEEAVNSIAESIDFDAISTGIGKIIKALAPVGEGFGKGFAAFFEALKKVGVVFFTLLGPALEAIADAIGKIPTPILEEISTQLGFILAPLLILKGAGILLHLVTNLPLIGSALGTVSTGLTAVSGGLVAFMASVSPVLIFVISLVAALHNMTIEIADTTEELAPYTEAHQTTYDILSKLATQYGLTKSQIAELAWEMHGATEEGSDAAGTYARIEANLIKAGVSVDDFNTSLADASTTAAESGQDISDISSYLANVNTNANSAKTGLSNVSPEFKDLGDKAADADANTGSINDTLNALNGMGIATPLKVALISGAIKALGDKGALSDGKIQGLQEVLDDYDERTPVQSMGKIAKAFDNAGVSSDDFSKALPESVKYAKSNMQMPLRQIVNNLKNLSTTTKTTGTTSGNNLGTGLVNGINSSQGPVKKAGKDLVNAGVNAVDAAGQMHSPSLVMKTRGQYLGQGLASGLLAEQTKITQTATTLIKAISTVIQNAKESFKTAGSGLATSLGQGVTAGKVNVTNAMVTIVNAMKGKISKTSFWKVGQNIAIGIHNGLVAHKGYLAITAWNIGVAMYNSICKALSIASPSKKFAWVGTMITEGLADGIETTQDNPVNTVEDLANKLTETAEDINPSVNMSASIDNWITSLDSILDKFSDTVVTKFDALMDTLGRLATISDVNLPAVTQGKVVPSSISSYGSASSNNDTVMRALESLATDQLTRDDLLEILTNVIRENMNISLYIGDEQIARHANSGNLKLSRRYSTIT